MSQELGYQAYVDQTRITPRLIVAGVGLLLAGVCGTCILASLPLVLTRGASTPVMSNATLRVGLMMTGVMVLIATVAAIWTGVACFLGKRWVRPIVLIASVVGLALAVPSVVMMSLTMSQNPSPAPPWAATVGIVVLAVVYFGFPLAYLLMFLPQHVQTLLNRLDPQPRWTDPIPVPLLGMSLVALWMALQLPLMLAVAQPMFFSLALPRLTAALPLLALMAGQLFGAVLLYRRRVAGWWLVVGIVLFLSLSNATNLLVRGSAYYDAAFGPDVSAQIRRSPIGSTTRQLITQLLSLGVMLAGAAWVKVCCLTCYDYNEHATIGSPASPE